MPNTSAQFALGHQEQASAGKFAVVVSKPVTAMGHARPSIGKCIRHCVGELSSHVFESCPAGVELQDAYQPEQMHSETKAIVQLRVARDEQ